MTNTSKPFLNVEEGRAAGAWVDTWSMIGAVLHAESGDATVKSLGDILQDSKPFIASQLSAFKNAFPGFEPDRVHMAALETDLKVMGCNADVVTVTTSMAVDDKVGDLFPQQFEQKVVDFGGSVLAVLPVSLVSTFISDAYGRPLEQAGEIIVQPRRAPDQLPEASVVITPAVPNSGDGALNPDVKKAPRGPSATR